MPRHPSCLRAPSRASRSFHALAKTILLVFVALLALTAVGCKVTNQDIDTWKGTVKGPGKLVAVMMAEKYDLPLRTYAALALVDMERNDVDGVAELQRAVQTLEGDVRTALVAGLAPGLIRQMQKPAEEQSAGVGPSTSQIRAKDAAFLLIPSAKDQSRQDLTSAVVGWYVEDFNGRSLSGNFSAEQVIRALGAPAAQQLVEALDSKLPQQALVKLAELIGQLGRSETVANAGRKLVKIEQEMRSDAFLKWLSGEIRSQLTASGGKINEPRILKVATLNRNRFIENAAIPAMKYLASEPPVAIRLLEIAEDKSPNLSNRRTKALRALEGKAKVGHLNRLLALALDASAPVSVRDYAFDRVGDIRSPKAIAPMWPLVENADQTRLRWRAGELVLAIGGPAIIAQFFSKLPSGSDVQYEPEELEGYATRMGQMKPLPTSVLRAQLTSTNWWNQVVALKYFERKGTLADIPAMERLRGQKTAVLGKHWGKLKNVGTVAEQSIAGLRERVKQAASAAKGDAS